MTHIDIDRKLKVRAQREKELQVAIRSYRQRQNELSTLKVLLTTMILTSTDLLQMKTQFGETEVVQWNICGVATEYDASYKAL